MSSLLVLVPLFAVIVMNLPLKGMKDISFPVALLFVAAQSVLSFMMPATFWNMSTPSGMFSNFSLNFSVDSISIVMLLSIGIVAFAALIAGWHSIGGTNQEHKTDFANILLLCVAGMNGIVMVTDLFSMYVFLEVVAVSSFILIAFHRNILSLEGAFKYIVMSAIATILMLASIGLLLMIAGDTSFITLASALAKPEKNPIVILAVGIFLVGLFIKGGLVPFHGWLPDAYSSAPNGVSILLAGIVTKTTGVYTLIKLVTAVFGFTESVKNILLIVGLISIVVGALAALGQKDFKRMLAYSSISQVGYIILSLGAGSALGVLGAVFHLFNHSIFKSQLFINAAAVEEQTGTRDMDKLGGIAAKMPVTGTTTLVALLSTVGIPPFSGFWSKLIIIIALWQSACYFSAIVAVVASVITLAYFLSMQRRVFFGKLRGGFENLTEAKLGNVVPAVILALITIGVGVCFPYILNTFILPIKDILPK